MWLAELFRTTATNNEKPAKVLNNVKHEKQQAIQDSKEVPFVNSDASKNVHDEISKPLTLLSEYPGDSEDTSNALSD